IPAETRELLMEYPDIAVHNLHHNTSATAESALALLLAAAKLIIPMDRSLRSNDWQPRYRPNPAVLLEGKTLLILGYGQIGQYAARICRAMGMHIMATKKHLEGGQGADEIAEIHPPEALHDLLPKAEVVLITLPLTEETGGLIGERELEVLPPKAILVNVGRGAIVDQEALFKALKDGTLHAAGLDVWYNYPADEAGRADTSPADFPFRELENVVMSPHRGGGSNETEFSRMRHLGRLLNAAARGEEMPNQVDIRAGY
ncbi:MAG: hydroxyacid dehydrogenase, partial [Anaerolineae bacterium]|nr:hydroxyacid dehydrogenase [Anaerolineae bacterium]